jgi:hypothetical protein
MAGARGPMGTRLNENAAEPREHGDFAAGRGHCYTHSNLLTDDFTISRPRARAGAFGLAVILFLRLQAHTLRKGST